MNSDVFGNQGDFITSPEISQMFGEVWWNNNNNNSNIINVSCSCTFSLKRNKSLYDIRILKEYYTKLKCLFVSVTAENP